MTRVFMFLLALGFVSSQASAQWFPFPNPFGQPEQATPAAAAEKLAPLGGDAKQVSVSGISAGAFMATQLQVAYSSSIMGVGSIAGGPWNCAQGDATHAQVSCMFVTSQIDSHSLVDQAKSAAQSGDLDALSNLKSARVYLYNSKADQIVREPMSQKTKDFFAAFTPAANIKVEQSVPSAHGFPTLDFGSACGTMGDPYLNNCHFDGAGELLKFIYPARPLVRGTMDPKSLIVFDQTEFGESTMADSAWAYIPQKCRVKGAACPVHVALHGCHQSGEEVQAVYATHAGYNEWAEGSGLIVLYPQTHKGSGNPNGCFDWWGYTDQNYANKNGVQMKAIKAMIDRVTGS